MPSMSTKLVLLPADLSDGSDIVPGSSRVEAGCGHLAWIAPSGMRMLLKAPGVRTICKRCVASAKVDGMAVVPGGQQELEQTLGVAMADQIGAQVKAANEQLRNSRKRRKRPRG